MTIGDVKARIVRSDGQEMTLGDGEWRIPKDGLENWANLPLNVSYAEIPSYDGSIVTSKRVESVDRSIKAVVGNSARNKELRERAIRFFNPRHSFKVFMTYMGRTRCCSGEQLGFKASEFNIYEPVEIEWTILCPNPFMQSVSDFGRDIAEIVPAFGFPFMSFLTSEARVNRGFIAGAYSFDDEVTIENDGDVASGMRFKITAKDEVVNPSIHIGDGFVRLKTTMAVGDVIEMDASKRPPTITLNGKNAMHLVDRRSSILAMEIGTGSTVISYGADSGEQGMSVVVRYNKQYLGV